MFYLDQYKRHFRAFHERGNLDPESELVELITLRERAQKNKIKKVDLGDFFCLSCPAGATLVRAAHNYVKD